MPQQEPNQPATRRLLRTFRWDALSQEETRMLRLLLQHQGGAHAILVPVAAEAVGIPERRAQDVVKSLVETHGVPVGSSSAKPFGWFLCVTEAERVEQRASLRGRALSILQRARAFEPGAHSRLAEIFGDQVPLAFGGAHG